MKEYKPYIYKNKMILIERYILLGKQLCEPENYDMFDMQINPFASDKIVDLCENGYSRYNSFCEQNDGGFNSLSSFEDLENKKVYFYTEIYSKTRTKIIINVLCAKGGKLWVNGKCVSNHQNDGPVHYYVSAHMEKGKNVLLLEQYSPRKSNLFSIQIRNYKFEMSNDYRALSMLGNVVQIDPLVLISEPIYKTTGPKYKFMYMRNGINPYCSEYDVSFDDCKIGFLKNYIANINEVIEVDVDELRKLHKGTVKHEEIICTFKSRSGRRINANFCIFLNQVDENIFDINAKALAYKNELSSDVSENLTGLINRVNLFKDNKDYIALYWYSLQLKEIIECIESGIYQNSPYKKPGRHEFFIHSELDDSNIRMMAHIPKGYDSSKAYPVILALSTSNAGTFCWGPIEDNVYEPCLCFDVTGRGVTGGSYVGESSTLEIFEWIKKNYKIDEDRVYILGHSNGSYATYSVAQHHPHLVAAIFPQTGNPYMKTVDNLLNTPTYQMVSNKDSTYIGNENVVKNALIKYENYYQYDFKDMTHGEFNLYIHHKGVLNEMLKAKRNLLPDKIIYITEQNRYLQSFWIKLHGIAKTYKTANVKAQIVNSRLIKINIRGSRGITLTIPPQIDRQNFSIQINNRNFSFNNCDEYKLIFCKKKVWTISNEELPIDYRKGTGLLDVYLNRMRIILPENGSKTLREVAENFASPFTNGFDTKIYTNYPIYLDNDVPKHIFSYNLILIDLCGNNSYVSRFEDKFAIKYDEKGFEYNGIYTDAQYVIMQVIPNPFDANLSILVISTNNDKLLKKNLFTRKVIIPFNVNGIHPYWNNKALIYDSDKYYGIYEHDMNEIK